MIDYGLLSFGLFILGAFALAGWAAYIGRDKPSDYPEKHLKAGE